MIIKNLPLFITISNDTTQTNNDKNAIFLLLSIVVCVFVLLIIIDFIER